MESLQKTSTIAVHQSLESLGEQITAYYSAKSKKNKRANDPRRQGGFKADIADNPADDDEEDLD